MESWLIEWDKHSSQLSVKASDLVGQGMSEHFSEAWESFTA